MSDLVRNAEDRLCTITAHLIIVWLFICLDNPRLGALKFGIEMSLYLPKSGMIYGDRYYCHRHLTPYNNIIFRKLLG